MDWGLKQFDDGKITNLEIIALYELLICSVSDIHQQLAQKISSQYLQAKIATPA